MGGRGQRRVGAGAQRSKLGRGRRSPEGSVAQDCLFASTRGMAGRQRRGRSAVSGDVVDAGRAGEGGRVGVVRRLAGRKLGG